MAVAVAVAEARVHFTSCTVVSGEISQGIGGSDGEDFPLRFVGREECNDECI